MTAELTSIPRGEDSPEIHAAEAAWMCVPAETRARGYVSPALKRWAKICRSAEQDSDSGTALAEARLLNKSPRRRFLCPFQQVRDALRKSDVSLGAAPTQFEPVERIFNGGNVYRITLARSL